MPCEGAAGPSPLDRLLAAAYTFKRMYGPTGIEPIEPGTELAPAHPARAHEFTCETPVQTVVPVVSLNVDLVVVVRYAP